jgi:hypothetical protein
MRRNALIDSSTRGTLPETNQRELVNEALNSVQDLHEALIWASTDDNFVAHADDIGA